MKLSFHGADQGVTGSCHLLECAGKKILIDCGLYQGSREIVEKNSADFGFDPAEIDYLLLTHADHAELLSWHGYTGEPESMQTFVSKLPGTEVLMPELHQTFTL